MKYLEVHPGFWASSCTDRIGMGETHSVRWRTALRVLAIFVSAFAPQVRAQQTARSLIAVRVDPEAYVEPRTLSLRFTVSPDGSVISPQTATLSAWVRALPGQQIQLSARASGDLTGERGVVPVSALRWKGTRLQFSAGAGDAHCTEGNFDGNSPAKLVDRWERSGILTCRITFSLSLPVNIPPGNYSVNVTFAVNGR